MKLEKKLFWLIPFVIFTAVAITAGLWSVFAKEEKRKQDDHSYKVFKEDTLAVGKFETESINGLNY